MGVVAGQPVSGCEQRTVVPGDAALSHQHWIFSDPYWGIGAGYKTGKWTFDSNDPDFGKTAFKTPIPFGFETTVGLRYYFTDMIGFYAELGIAKSVIQGGIAIKL